jgi:hypothetical protein
LLPDPFSEYFLLVAAPDVLIEGIVAISIQEVFESAVVEARI